MPRLIESIENKSLKRNYDLYKVPERLKSQINVHTIRFENISTALNTYLESQDIPRIDLPHAKKGGGFKDKFILEIVTPLQLSKINDYFSEEFRDFNYPKLRFVWFFPSKVTININTILYKSMQSTFSQPRQLMPFNCIQIVDNHTNKTAWTVGIIHYAGGESRLQFL